MAKARSGGGASGDVDAMLRRVRAAGRDGARASRLFACACGRLAWDWLSDDLGRPSVAIGEWVADGRMGWSALRGEYIRIGRDDPGRPTLHRASVSLLMLYDYSSASAAVAARDARELARQQGGEDHSAAQADLVRDLFGDPDRPIAFDPDWSTPAVGDLARSIYEGRSFDAMPMLGDALEEAGCGSPDVLDHCRGPRRHARGCWVLDAAMGVRR